MGGAESEGAEFSDTHTTSKGGIVLNAEDGASDGKRGVVVANVLTIAGSDSGGGAGIQADLKTIGALGAYGLSAVTTLTAQNTHGILAMHTPDAGFLKAQLDAIFADIRVDAVKIGALVNAENVRVVASVLRELPRLNTTPIVLDPVMVPKGEHGRLLQDEEALKALRDKLVPLATLVTPNLPEAAALLDIKKVAANEAEMYCHGEALLVDGAKAVLMKGGHLPNTPLISPDLLFFRKESTGEVFTRRFEAPRLSARNTHGTGCTLSSAIACNLLTYNNDLETAVQEAKRYVSGAIAAAAGGGVGTGFELDVGTGTGPLCHFYRLWRSH